MKEKTVKKKKGGKRPGAGRKPAQSPMIPITIYVSEPDVLAWGGKTELKEKLSALVACTKAPSDTFPIRVVDPISQKQAVALHNAENEDQATVVFHKRLTKPKGGKPVSSPVEFVATPTPNTHDTPPLAKSLQDEPSKAVPIKPRNLDELKALCPYPEKSEERSNWVRTERQKYGI